jgi:hypothetical protein
MGPRRPRLLLPQAVDGAPQSAPSGQRGSFWTLRLDRRRAQPTQCSPDAASSSSICLCPRSGSIGSKDAAGRRDDDADRQSRSSTRRRRLQAARASHPTATCTHAAQRASRQSVGLSRRQRSGQLTRLWPRRCGWLSYFTRSKRWLARGSSCQLRPCRQHPWWCTSPAQRFQHGCRAGVFPVRA